jgi:predicted nucleic acid-binding protein
MNVVLDNNALVFLLNPDAHGDVKARLRGLLAEVEGSRGQVLIPTPVLTEYLSHAPEQTLRQTLMTRFRTSRWVAVVSFDELAAEECAAMYIRAKLEGDKRAPLEPTTAWQSVKIDRQIVAIAKVRGAMIVTGDDDVLKVAAWANIRAVKAQDVPIPESERQMMIAGVKPVLVPEAPRRRLRLERSAPPAESGGESPV